MLRIRDVYPGFWIRLISIPDPGSTSKNLSRIRILIFYSSRIPDPGVKKVPDPDPQHCFSARLSPPLGIVLGADKSVADDAEVQEEEDGGDGEGEGEDELPWRGRHKGVQLDTVLRHALRPVLVRRK